MSDEQQAAPSAARERASEARKGGLSRRAIIGIGVVATLVIGGGVGVAFALNGQEGPPPAAAAKRSHEPAPKTLADVPFAAEAMFRGTLGSWQLPSSPELAAVLPATGSARSGQVVLAVDAPAPREAAIAAVTTANVMPETSYHLSAWVRLQSAQPVAIPASLLVGDTVIQLPDSSAEWREVQANVEIPVDVTSVDIALRVDGAISGLSIDDVSLTADGGDNVVPNPSFEEVQPGAVIANDSLVMPTSTAVIAAAVPMGDVSWELLNDAGELETSGTAVAATPITPISFVDVPQGFHTVNLTDATGQQYSFPVALIDTPGSKIVLDERLGVTAQFKRDWHAGGGRLAAALGFGDVRAEANWKWNETNFGQYDWDPTLLKEFASVRAHGVKSTGVIVYVNKFYDNGIMPTSAEALDAYGRYAAAATQTFGFDAVEVYNEPNQEKFNKSACGLGPTCYIPLIDAVRNHLAAEEIGIPVVGGGIALYDSDWFAGFWQAGAMDRVDAVSYHPYEGWIQRNPDLIRTTVAQSIADMQQYVGATKPIWITEMGFTTMTGGVTQEQQGDWLIRSAALALAGGVEKYFWYDIVDDDPDPANGEGNFGLYEHSPRAGMAVVAPKRSAFAQALLITQLDRRAIGGDESDEVSNVIRFGDEDDAVRVAWSVGEPSELSLRSETAVQVVASDGTTSVVDPVDGEAVIPLTDRPSFISSVEPATE
ncbi:glycosyl hydrolase [Microbacterium sp. A588]